MKISREVFEKAMHLKDNLLTKGFAENAIYRVIRCYHHEQHCSMDTVRIVECEYKLVVAEEGKK